MSVAKRGAPPALKEKQRPLPWARKNALTYHLLLLPGIILLIIFNVLPMFGTVMAFQDFIPSKGIIASKWVGWENFRFMFILPDSRTIFVNTVIIAFGKIVFSLLASLVFALLLHEIRNAPFKRTVQTMVYLPHFLSWVILAGIVQFILAKEGIVNHFLANFGIDGPVWLSSNLWFRPILIITHVWQEFGFGAIIFLAALTGINPNLYEAAEIDGANRWHKLVYITLPGIAPIITLVAALSIGGILSAGFEQIFNLYNPLVYATGDVIDTWVYRAGLLDAQYSLAAAVGLLQSVAAFVLILISYLLAHRYAGYRIF
jgi:putative aldouronate transport system permease protein